MDTAETTLLPDHPWVPRRRLTATEYHQMAEAGILHEDDRVELIEGELLAMAPIGSEHNGATDWLARALIRAIGDRGIVRVQGSIRLDDQTEPQPDFAVLRPRPDFYRKSPPTPPDILLLIEIADSSLRFDRAIKRPLYARHAVPEYWIVDLPGQAVEVHRTPTQHGYASAARLGPERALTIEALPDVTISVAELLG
jgi:hypothetical protein